MRLPLLAFTLIGLSGAALAETADEKRQAIAAVFETALREHAVFLNCSATDANTHAIVRASWQETVESAVALMTSHQVAPAFVAQFKERGAYAKIMRLDAPLREIIAMCPAGWEKPYYELRFVILHSEVSKILNR